MGWGDDLVQVWTSGWGDGANEASWCIPQEGHYTEQVLLHQPDVRQLPMMYRFLQYSLFKWPQLIGPEAVLSSARPAPLFFVFFRSSTVVLSAGSEVALSILPQM